MRRLIRIALVVTFAVLPAVAQQHPNNARGFDPEKAYQMGDLDSVNLFNGNLVVSIPIGQRFPVSDHLQYGLTLLYNGNPWEYWQDGVGPEAIPSRFDNVGIGWQLTLGDLVSPNDAFTKKLNKQGNWVYAAPDGAERVFYRALHEEEIGTQYEASATPGDDDVAGYTRDSSYLRLVRKGLTSRFEREGGIGGKITWFWTARYKVEFPDGTVYTFKSEEYVTEDSTPPATAFEQSAKYSLEKMEDRFGNFVTITDETISGGTKRTITDSVGRTHTITSTTQAFYQSGDDDPYRALVTSVKLSAPHSKTVEYAFTYGGYDTISKPCIDADAHPSEPPTTSGRFLTAVTARDADNTAATLLRYSMIHHKLEQSGGSSVCSNWAGHLTTLALPTGGRIEYEAGVRAMPAIVEGKPKEGGGSPVTTSIAVGKRTMVNTDALNDSEASRSTWTYHSYLRNPGTYETGPGQFKNINRELVVLVTDPLQRSSANYFNAYVISGETSTSCYPSPDTREDGLPFTRTANTGVSDVFLSTETYPTACTSFEIGSANGCPVNLCKNGSTTVLPIRRSYVAYDYDTLSTETGQFKDSHHNQRLNASRTTFLDDTGCGSSCYVETRMTEFDGLGHYRSQAQSSNFPATTTRTARTNYNANLAAGTYARDSGSSASSYMVAKTEPWLLGLHDEIKTSQTSSTDIVEKVCFDRSSGFLTRRRALAGTATARTDLVTGFSQASGNVTGEAQYGGDVDLLPTSNGCTDGLGTASYEMTHTYASGVRVGSQYQNASFKSLDLTVDSTGLPTMSKDSSGLPTQFNYDVLGRITEMRPFEEAWTQYVYDLESTNFYLDPASVTVKVWPYGSDGTTGTPIVEKRHYYDGLGRLIQSRTQMPSGWSTVQSAYDLLGRRTSQSTPEYKTSGDYAYIDPAHETTFSYDRFDRVTQVTQPDGKISTTTYSGTRVVTNTVKVGTSASYDTTTNLPEIAETDVSRTQYFDSHGRLKSVEEKGTGATLVSTSYGYDTGNRLTRVEMYVGGVTQIREFKYDGRGALLWEKVPEKGASGKGKVFYGTVDGSGNVTPLYDAGGMPRRKIDVTSGGKFDLAFTYDSAKRLTTIEDLDANGLRRTLQSVMYATANEPSGCTSQPCDARNGKPQIATRYNYVPDLGTVAVTETYEYKDVGGRPKRRQTTVSNTAEFSGASFDLNQDWNEQGQLISITYPTTTSYPSAPSRTIGYTYTKGLLTGVTGYATLTYQANGLIDTVTHGSGASAVEEHWVPDPNGMARPMMIEMIAPATTRWQEYAFDGAGNIVRIGNTSYTYDPLNRLTNWTEWFGTNVYGSTTRITDGFGNHLYTIQKGCGSSGRCFDTGFVPLAVDAGSNHYAHETYDDAGNVVSDGTHTFAYDGAGRMVSLIGNGRNERYLYTADDERIAIVKRIATANGTKNKTEWTLRGTNNQLLRTFTDNSETGTRVWSWTEDEIWRGSNLLASESSSGRKQYHLDHLGSPRWVTNTSGTLLGEQRFQPFGDGGTLDGGRIQFTGHERDGRDKGDPIDYLHARYMVAGTGRFLSVDPTWASADLTRPQSWNRYAYVMNNPVNVKDPDGRCGAPCVAVMNEIQVYVATHPEQVERVTRALFAVLAMSESADDDFGTGMDTDTAATETAVAEGIYEFPDAENPGLTYVGQSGNVPQRLDQHENSGKKDANDSARTTEVKGGKTAREHAEQNRINELGGKSGTPGSATSNKVNPIGPKRAPTVQELYGPIKPPQPQVIPKI